MKTPLVCVSELGQARGLASVSNSAAFVALSSSFLSPLTCWGQPKAKIQAKSQERSPRTPKHEGNLDKQKGCDRKTGGAH